MTYFQHITVTSGDIDDLGHVNNLVYIKWILEAAEAHWIHETDSNLRDKYGWVVLSHHIQYKWPAYETDQLIIETWVENYTAIHCERHTKIINKVTGKVLVSAVTKWCPVSIKTLKPVRMIPELVDPFLKDQIGHD